LKFFLNLFRRQIVQATGGVQTESELATTSEATAQVSELNREVLNKT